MDFFANLKQDFRCSSVPFRGGVIAKDLNSFHFNDTFADISKILCMMCDIEIWCALLSILPIILGLCSVSASFFSLTFLLIKTTPRGVWLPCYHIELFPLLPPCSVFIWLFLCLLSDSFSGTNHYSTSALFHSEPPALAALFRGTYMELKMRKPAQKPSF